MFFAGLRNVAMAGAVTVAHLAHSRFLASANRGYLFEGPADGQAWCQVFFRTTSGSSAGGLRGT